MLRLGLGTSVMRSMVLPTRGLEEFFKNKRSGRVGKSWPVHLLRKKSFEDLHKLWFVLLKERNMLYTYAFDCQRLHKQMHNQERLKKVAQSMARIKIVIHERHLAHKAKVNPAWLHERIQRMVQQRTLRLSILAKQKKSIGKFRSKRRGVPQWSRFGLTARAPTEPYDPFGGRKHVPITAKAARKTRKVLRQNAIIDNIRKAGSAEGYLKIMRDKRQELRKDHKARLSARKEATLALQQWRQNNLFTQLIQGPAAERMALIHRKSKQASKQPAASLAASSIPTAQAVAEGVQAT